jgi:hypothetical protein
MSVSSNRSVLISMTGDIEFIQEFPATENTAAPGLVTNHTLASGNNTITVPTGFTVKAATIVPQEDNAVALTLKGVGGDTGIVISSTAPTSIGFETAPANFVINAGAGVTVRIVWS